MSPPLARPPLNSPPGPTSLSPFPLMLSLLSVALHFMAGLSPGHSPAPSQQEMILSRREHLGPPVTKGRLEGSQASQERQCEVDGCRMGIGAKRKDYRGGARNPSQKGTGWRILQPITEKIIAQC